jgi:hypothetical protein
MSSPPIHPRPRTPAKELPEFWIDGGLPVHARDFEENPVMTFRSLKNKITIDAHWENSD